MRSKLLPLIVAITVVACQLPALPISPAATATPSSSTFFTETPTQTAVPTGTATSTPTPTLTPTPAHHASRVLILSIDGLRPDAILAAPMPNLLGLMQTSARTLNAKTVYPSVTLIAHASMLGGVCPSKHGVDWNDYLPEKGYALGTDLFDLAHAAGLQTVMYVGKEKLIQLTEPSSVDIYRFINDRDLVIADRLIADFPQDFNLLFVHFPLVDGMGHRYGWMSPQQLNVAYRADEALGMILAELDARGIRDETLIMVTADHGGHDTLHGSRLREDMTIPWIASGPGIQPKVLTTQVNTMDTAATAAFALGLSIPPEWDGVPIYEAFGLPVERQSAPCE
ncbi:MAG: alkaline phosphatase family protein [Chloroflexi bacterium]|nr:alkaline phosphatase family protein [Chloroflexota bacterium]